MASMIDPIDARDSAAIRVARVLCIFFMMSAHIPGAYGVSYVLQGDGAIVGELWIDILGRASVAVLSLVSGFLLVGALEKFNPIQIVKDRFRVLIMPMITWNLILLLMVLGASAVGVHLGLKLPAATPLGLANALTGVLGASFNSPLSFLRDLFVASLLLVLFWRPIRRHLMLALVIVLGLSVFELTAPVVLRPTILLFMLGGCALRVNRIQLSEMARAKPLFCGILCSGLVFLACHFAGTDQGPIAALENIAKRVALSFAMIALALAIGRSSHVQAVFDLFEPVAFLAYLSHTILAKLIWVLMGGVGVDIMGPSYLIYFFTAPALVFILCLPMRWIIDFLPAPLPVLVKGKPSRKSWRFVRSRSSQPPFPS